jgi:hypothetical protein
MWNFKIFYGAYTPGFPLKGMEEEGGGREEGMQWDWAGSRRGGGASFTVQISTYFAVIRPLLTSHHWKLLINPSNTHGDMGTLHDHQYCYGQRLIRIKQHTMFIAVAF